MHLADYAIVEGRRPAGLITPAFPPASSVTGDYLARLAFVHAGSAIAFSRLARELDAHGAPEPLVVACEDAKEAELRHARSLGRLAREHGGTPVAPARQTVRMRGLVDLAIENIVEGCVRETFGVEVARRRARDAEDHGIRRVMQEIEGDQEARVELAFDIATWLQSVVDPLEGIWVESAMRHAARSLARELDVDVSEELSLRAGVPSRLDALSIWSTFSKTVWRRDAERVWSVAA